jgi:hypothetical protein
LPAGGKSNSPPTQTAPPPPIILRHHLAPDGGQGPRGTIGAMTQAAGHPDGRGLCLARVGHFGIDQARGVFGGAGKGDGAQDAGLAIGTAA